MNAICFGYGVLPDSGAPDDDTPKLCPACTIQPAICDVSERATPHDDSLSLADHVAAAIDRARAARRIEGGDKQ